MTSTRSALDADWLGVCRRAVAGLERDPRRGRRPPRSAPSETGTRGSGGDRTLVIDRAAEAVVFDELDGALRPRATASRAISEERGEVDYGDSRRARDHRPDRRLAERQAQASRHYALSIAVADGPTMADVAFGFVYDFGAARGVVGARAARAPGSTARALDPVAARAPRPRRPPRAARDRVGRPALGRRRRSTALVDARLPPAGAGHDRRDAVPGRGRALRRDGLAAALPRRRRRRRPADRARGRRARQLPGCDEPLGAPLDVDAELARGRGPVARDARASSARIPPVIDWIIAERIATFVAGTGERRTRRAPTSTRSRPSPSAA